MLIASLALVNSKKSFGGTSFDNIKKMIINIEKINMIKKITLIILCSLILISCGKKADPEYKQKKIFFLVLIVNILNKNFSIERVKAKNLVKKFGSFIAYSYERLKTNIINFKTYFKSFNPLVCFAIKANPNVQLLKEIKKLGCGADVVSIGELMKALKAGISAKKIVFSGVGKTSEEIDYAIEKKILLINAESKVKY